MRVWLVLPLLLLAGCQDYLPQEEVTSTQTCALLAGDSWSMFDAYYGSLERALQTVDDTCQVAYSLRVGHLGDQALNLPLTMPGTRAEQWNSVLGFVSLVRLLEENPDTDLLVLYLGGNDFVQYYHNGGRDLAAYNCDAAAASLPNGDANTDANTDANRASYIAGEAENLIYALLAYGKTQGRNLRIALNGYTRLNFVQGEGVRPSSYKGGVFDKQYGVSRGLWQNMGCPSMTDFNTGYLELDQAFTDFASGAATHNSGLADYLQALENRLANLGITVNLSAKLDEVNLATQFYYLRHFNRLTEGSTGATRPQDMWHQPQLSGSPAAYDYIDSIHLAPPAQDKLAKALVADLKTKGWVK